MFFFLRGILHDEKLYPQPEMFQPERFLKNGKLNPDVLDPERVAFGYGRRSVVLVQMLNES